MVLSVDPSNSNALTAANNGAVEVVSAADSVNSATMFNAAVEAVGPIGTTYLAAYRPAQANNLSSTLLDGGVHAAISEAANSSFAANDA
jgi:hypothetical protein